MITLWTMSAFAQESAAISEEGAAPRFGVMAEIGSLRNADQAYDLFSDSNGMFGWGARAVVRPADRLEVRIGYQNVREGSRVTAGLGYSDYTTEGPRQFFQTAFYGHQVTAGLRADVSLGDVLFPYAALDGVVLAALARLDDDAGARDNLGQVSASALAPGAALLGGIELRVPPYNEVQCSWHLELGYTMLASLSLGDFGPMQAGGLTVRSGLGVRF